MDNTPHRGEPDRSRISLQQAHEVAHWMHRFGVTREQLEQAVRTVGDKSEAVEQYLREHGHVIVKKI